MYNGVNFCYTSENGEEKSSVVKKKLANCGFKVLP